MSLATAKERFMQRRPDDDSSLYWERWRHVEDGTYRDRDFFFVRFNTSNNSSSGYPRSEEYATQLEALEDFCKEHELAIFGNSKDYILNDVSVQVFTDFYLVEPLADDTYESLRALSGFGSYVSLGKTIECPGCEATNSRYRYFCHSCEETLCCNNCNMTPFLWHLSQILEKGEEFVIYPNTDCCSSCSNICVTCSEHWMPSGFSLGVGARNNYDQCLSCLPRFSCRNCGDIQLGESDHNHPYCDGCSENLCTSCNNFFDDGRHVEENGERICHRCFNGLEKNIEVFDDDSEMPATKLALPTIEGRERIRFCGLEIEGVNKNSDGHDLLAYDLFNLGVSRTSHRRGYHERSDGSFAHIERDSSCDWEAVIGPVNMASNTDVRNLNRVIKAIRERIKDNTVKLSLNCGLHIHVSAEKVGIKQAHNLHLLYTYMEDVIYRLGAAKWPMHRAVVNGDHSYQLSPRMSGKMNFINTYMDNRYYGLSFSNYFQKMLNSCGCGAGRFGVFEECECSLNKCTFEFRIFNTTANTRKIHAYTALTQALVAKGLSVSSLDLQQMPALSYNMRNVKDMNSSEQDTLIEAWIPRMEFILQELPLTEEEKLSIIYCVENSELSPITEHCKQLVNKTEVTI